MTSGSIANAELRAELRTDELEARLASASLKAGDPTGWFEPLYVAGEAGGIAMPWSREEAHPLLADRAAACSVNGAGRRAVVVGCALGADAEYVCSLGYATTAFDISPTAIRQARSRHAASSVEYHAADLLDPPVEWLRSFDLVVEIITVQALPGAARRAAIVNVGRLVGPGGSLVAIAAAGKVAAARSPALPPWPLERGEIEAFATDGLEVTAVELLSVPGSAQQHWRAQFRRPVASPMMTSRGWSPASPRG